MGLIHDFGQKFEYFLFVSFSLSKIGLDIVFGDVMDTRQAFTDYKIVYFTWSLNWFSKGLVHDFGQKFQISLLFLFE